MSNASSSTPFPLGAYFGGPDSSDASDEANFEQAYNSFTAAEGAAPSFLDTYIQQSLPISEWDTNSGWAASSFADSADSRNTTPVIGLPLSSTAAGSLTQDQSFQAFASGQYDGVLQGIVQAWASDGFKNIDFRPGWEMNLQGYNYAGSTAQDQSDWVAAFQHVYTVLHQAAAADGVNVQVVWNPGVTNYSTVPSMTALYPGNNYVDVVGVDAYADIYPFNDGGSTPTYHDWDTGGEDTSVAQFIADPVNREHYWSYPSANIWSLDSSGGHSETLSDFIQFAEQQGKPFAIPETGAGNTNSGTDVSDDAAYPQWLAQQLTAAEASGAKIDFVNLWDSNGGGTYQFSLPSDDKPAEAAAWAQYFGAQTSTSSQAVSADTSGTSPAASVTTSSSPAVSIGSGSDTLSLSMAEDAWQGDAQYTINVNGTTIGGVETATASQSAGATQTVSVSGNWGADPTIGISFINDAYGGSSSTDRNLYADGASYDGQALQGAPAALFSNGTADLTVPTNNTGLTLNLAEDAWNGDAQYSVSVDGTTIVQDSTVTALHSQQQSQAVNLSDLLSAGTHDVAVSFLNDAYGGTSAADRNLYVNGIDVDGQSVSGTSAALYSNGTQHFQITVPASS